jgi:hypothetical protein
MMKTSLAAGTASPLCASSRLVSAALAGLLCLAGCSKQDADGAAGAAGKSDQTGTGGNPAGGSSSQESAGAAGTEASPPEGLAGQGGVSAGGEGGTQDAGGTTVIPIGGEGGIATAGSSSDAGTAGSGGAAGAPPEYPHIVSSENVGVMTEEQFTALCTERGGIVEVMPHCGGFATAKGFSYDSTTQLLSEHTCAGANTCAGWNCVIP